MSGPTFRVFLPAALLACAAICRAAPVTVTDLKGRTIEIEVVSLAADTVTFTRTGNPKQFSMAVGLFDEASRETIRKTGAGLPSAAAPKIQVDPVIGKRRKKEDSYYMVKQEITCTMKLTNLSTTDAVPPLAGKIVFIGQNTRTPSVFNVLSTQEFQPSMKPGGSFSKELEAFVTSYDSDNKGSGNVGGFQYYAYVLAIMDDAGKVVLEQTSAGGFRMALAARTGLLQQVVAYPKGTSLTEKLEKSPVTLAR